MPEDYSLIAHRGLPAEFPENSLAGIQAALEAGAEGVELDIQFTRDGVPVLYHDENMQRLSGVDCSIFDLTIDALQRHRIILNKENSQEKVSAPIATLRDLVGLIADWPERRFFVELKRQSAEYFGVEPCVEKITQLIRPVATSCIPLSFNQEAVTAFRRQNGSDVGWVVHEWTDAQHRIADTIQPEFLFCNIKKLPDDPEEIWQGSWNWVLYSIDDFETLEKYLALGFRIFETNQYRLLSGGK